MLNEDRLIPEENIDAAMSPAEQPITPQTFFTAQLNDIADIETCADEPDVTDENGCQDCAELGSAAVFSDDASANAEDVTETDAARASSADIVFHYVSTEEKPHNSAADEAIITEPVNCENKAEESASECDLPESMNPADSVSTSDTDRKADCSTDDSDKAASGTSDDTEATDTALASAKEDTPAKADKSKRKDRSLLIIFALIALYALLSAGLFTSGEKFTEFDGEQKNISADISGEILSMKSSSLATVYNLPKVYILPWNELPTPIPSQAGYGSETMPDGTEVLTYNDETISVRYWCERQYNSNCHFAEIKIAHPTQLRTALAGGEFDPSIRRTPQQIAQQANAVIAINADFYGYRMRGLIIRQDVTYRTEPRGWDILLIDSDGNFHIMKDSQVQSSGILEQYDIVNTAVFGPSLVIDGEINILNLDSGCGDHWNMQYSPRTGIGQMGELHYLFCCVEGRNEVSRGIRTPELAQLMYDKGCIQAYNLDGGMSTTIIFGGEAMNAPMWGGQRPVTDIFYCTTALPNENGE